MAKPVGEPECPPKPIGEVGPAAAKPIGELSATSRHTPPARLSRHARVGQTPPSHAPGSRHPLGCHATHVLARHRLHTYSALTPPHTLARHRHRTRSAHAIHSALTPPHTLARHRHRTRSAHAIHSALTPPARLSRHRTRWPDTAIARARLTPSTRCLRIICNQLTD
jgi:hypothetical protein